MAEQIPINPNLLKWARETSGKSIEEVARVMGKSVTIVNGWENGEINLTFAQLEKLAYQVYKRPTAMFFFPTPPDDIDPINEFRTLPEYEIERFDPDTRFIIRNALALQLSLSEINNYNNPSQKIIFKDITYKGNIVDLTKVVRNYLDVSLDDQKSFSNGEFAFKEWRKAFEKVGIFIFKKAFKQKDISGFSLIDDEFPIIFINNKNTFTRQVFTLFHELAHILFNEYGVTKTNDTYISDLEIEYKTIEINCNKFASEFLVPDEDFDLIFDDNMSIRSIENLANIYSVSREVILRKLLDRGLISNHLYKEQAENWANQIRKGVGGGSYYATQIAYLGETYIDMVFKSYRKGNFSFNQIADFLNVKPKNVQKLEEYFYIGE